MAVTRRSFAIASALAPFCAGDEKPPLVAVTAEAHGAHVGLLGTPGLRTPRLDALAEAGTYYDRCFANAPWPLEADVLLRASEPREAYRQVLEALAKKPASVRVTIPAELEFATARAAVEPAEVRVPPVWPNIATARAAWAAYLASVQCVDAVAGAVFDAVRHSGQEEETLVMYAGLGGPAGWRGRGTLYHLALHVPLILRGPGIAAHQRKHELVSLATAAAPKAAELIRAANDRCRSVFDGRFHYLRNLQPGPSGLPSGEWREARDKYPLHWRLLTGAVPAEEFYDLDSDPWELHNLASDTAYSTDRIRLAELA